MVNILWLISLGYGTERVIYDSFGCDMGHISLLWDRVGHIWGIHYEMESSLKWQTGIASNGEGIFEDDAPDAKLTWSAIKTEMDRLQAEWDAKEYQRKRKKEYPSIEELVVALYDSDDKSAVDTKRAEIKSKYPKS